MVRRLYRSIPQAVRAASFLGPRLARNPSAVPTFLRVTTGVAFDAPPIVIGGCGRSGTSVLLSILSAHPAIRAIPYATHAFAPTLYTDDPDPEAPFQTWRLYWALTRMGPPGNARRWCEKTSKNVVTFGRLASHFEGEVRLIHLVRDGRDVVTSRHTFDPNRYWVEPERWIHDVSAGLAHRELECVHTLRYEDLVRSTSKTLYRLGEFLDEDLEGLAEWWTHEADVQRFGPFERRVAHPLDESGIGRWKEPEHRERAEQLLETPGARELLDALGYEV